MRLSKFILADTEAVLAEWERFAGMIPAARGLDRAALRDHAEQILRAIAADMVSEQTGEEQTAKSRGLAPRVDGADTAAESHGAGRYEVGFDLAQMVSEFRALRATVTRLWERELTPTDPGNVQELIRFNEALDQALAESTARFMRDLAQARELVLAVLAHDLRSPLGAVVQSGHFLVRSDLSPEQARAAGIVVSSGARINAMVTNLLDVARSRFGSPLPISRAPMDAASICRAVVEEVLAAHPGRRIVIDARGDTSGAWDAERLQQLVSNLLENAMTYGAPDRPITVLVDGAADELCLCVHNDGEPIPLHRQATLFEPLLRGEPTGGSRRSGGLGLGLFIVREIARAHGGHMTVSSEPGRGTTFEVRLPRAAPTG